jgi:molecular chaperone GrpE
MMERKRTQNGSEPNEPDTPDADRQERAAPGAEQAAEAVPEAVPEEPRTAREAELEAEVAATKERLLRALADNENLRRRTMRDLEEAHKYAITNFARELLEVADNLSRALDAVPPRAREEIDFVKNLADGVAITEKALLTCFERHNIAKVSPEIGEKFDHNRHQAMFEVPTADQAPGTVAQVLQPGYTIADRLLRPALVGVAKAPSSGPPAPEGDEAGQDASVEADVASSEQADVAGMRRAAD